MTGGTGLQVWAYAHGVDERQVEPPKSRKSVGAECNWGIRFQRDADATAFMDNLAGELSTRMKGVPLHKSSFLSSNPLVAGIPPVAVTLLEAVTPLPAVDPLVALTPPVASTPFVGVTPLVAVAPLVAASSLVAVTPLLAVLLQCGQGFAA